VDKSDDEDWNAIPIEYQDRSVNVSKSSSYSGKNFKLVAKH